jgi:hypothetical protein
MTRGAPGELPPSRNLAKGVALLPSIARGLRHAARGFAVPLPAGFPSKVSRRQRAAA